MSEFYNIFNMSYVEQQARQQHHLEQVKQVQDVSKALRDFLEGMEKIEPAYQDMARFEICAILASHIHI